MLLSVTGNPLLHGKRRRDQHALEQAALEAGGDLVDGPTAQQGIDLLERDVRTVKSCEPVDAELLGIAGLGVEREAVAGPRIRWRVPQDRQRPDYGDERRGRIERAGQVVGNDPDGGHVPQRPNVLTLSLA